MPEVEWDEEQQTIMLALGLHREMSCPGCGGWLPETTAEQAEDSYAAELVRCHRCSAHSIAADKTREMYRPQSLLLQVTRKARMPG